MSAEFTSEKVPTWEDDEVNILGTSLDVQFPVVRRSGYSLMCDIFGEKKDRFVVSPEGGIPRDEYYRLASEFRPGEKSTGCSRGDGENKAISTKRDTSRFWMLRNPEFHDELVEQGWVLFPEIREWSIHDKKESLRHSRDNYKYASRGTTVPDLTKVLQASTSQQHVEKLLERLGVIGKFMKEGNISVGYKQFTSSSKGDALVIGETTFPGIYLKLIDFRSSLMGHDPTPIIELNAAVYLGGEKYASVPDQWSEQTTARVRGLVRDKIGKNKRVYCQDSDDESFILSYDDRGETINDSAELEGRLNQVREWVQYGHRAAGLERDEIEKAREAIYEDRKTRLGNSEESA